MAIGEQTVTVREGWYADVCRARSELGSNDAEHDLLMEVADVIYERLGRPESCDGCGTLTEEHDPDCPDQLLTPSEG